MKSSMYRMQVTGGADLGEQIASLAQSALPGRLVAETARQLRARFADEGQMELAADALNSRHRVGEARLDLAAPVAAADPDQGVRLRDQDRRIVKRRAATA